MWDAIRFDLFFKVRKILKIKQKLGENIDVNIHLMVYLSTSASATSCVPVSTVRGLPRHASECRLPAHKPRRGDPGEGACDMR